MLIETRILGKKASPLDRWSIPDPPMPAERGDGDSFTLRDLITRVVHDQVSAFERREQARRFVRVLSHAEVADGAARGKVDPGGRAPTGPVDAEAAVGAALQGFEDGLFLVMLDGVEQRSLDSPVYLTPESKLVFLRLTFLAGA
ncbi:MAG TPA: hypothetical protein VHQ45_02240 [Gemmatimonadaceae bacterium]|nr:hypothetical protein [Gemmatimonadaceae bacterium]